MWPFNRKQTSTDKAPAMPPELTDYYQAEKRQQTIVTWLLGFATLAVTIAVAFGLFLGGRWLIHKTKKSPTAPQTTATQNSPKQTETPSNTIKPSDTSTTGQPSGGSTGQPASGGQVAAGSSQAPQTSSATTALPNTGPGETLAVFAFVTIAGATLHAVVRKRV